MSVLRVSYAAAAAKAVNGAAVKLQAASRGWYARRSVENERAESAERQQVQRRESAVQISYAKKKKQTRFITGEEEGSIVRLQAVARGWRARSRSRTESNMSTMSESSERPQKSMSFCDADGMDLEARADNHKRGEQVHRLSDLAQGWIERRKQKEEQKAQEAATRIQAISRGYITRRDSEVEAEAGGKEARRKKKKQGTKADAAAVKLQAATRGWSTRQSLDRQGVDLRSRPSSQLDVDDDLNWSRRSVAEEQDGHSVVSAIEREFRQIQGMTKEMDAAVATASSDMNKAASRLQAGARGWSERKARRKKDVGQRPAKGPRSRADTGDASDEMSGVGDNASAQPHRSKEAGVVGAVMFHLIKSAIQRFPDEDGDLAGSEDEEELRLAAVLAFEQSLDDNYAEEEMRTSVLFAFEQTLGVGYAEEEMRNDVRKAFEESLGVDFAEQDREEAAATALQAATRGRNVRRSLQQGQESSLSQRARSWGQDPAFSAAAVRVQAAIRGWVVRRQRCGPGRVAIPEAWRGTPRADAFNAARRDASGLDRDTLTAALEHLARHRGQGEAPGGSRSALLSGAQASCVWDAFVEGAGSPLMGWRPFCALVEALSQGPEVAAEFADMPVEDWEALGDGNEAAMGAKHQEWSSLFEAAIAGAGHNGLNGTAGAHNADDLVLQEALFLSCLARAQPRLRSSQVQALWQGYQEGTGKDTMGLQAFFWLAEAVEEGDELAAEHADMLEEDFAALGL